MLNRLTPSVDQSRPTEEPQHDEGEALLRTDDNRYGPVPVTPAEPSRYSGDDDLGRQM